MKNTLAIAALAVTMSACAGLGMDQRIDERLTDSTELSQEQRCLGYGKDIARLELFYATFGTLDEQRQKRLDALRAVKEAECA